MSAIEPGRELDGYRLGQQLGEGGMGVVYRAEQLATGRSVAVKVLQHGLADQEELRRRFERESRYAGALRHPNIVAVESVGEAAGTPYIVMELVPGSDLAALIERERTIAPDVTVEVLAQVARALDAVHEQGILHRDVKPANILLAGGEGAPAIHCMLTDFGLSRRPSRDSLALTSPGFFVGTTDYVAPEQLLADEVDHRVDVYSLGCILFHCLTGRPPFVGSNVEQALFAHVYDPPPSVTELRPDLPPAIDGVVATAMAKDPAERYATCVELAVAARAALGFTERQRPRAAQTPLLLLRFVVGKVAGFNLEVDEELLIGREAGDAGRLGEDGELSRRHARIRRADRTFVIEDLGSTNGTFVNARRIDEPVRLSIGDRIELGTSSLVVLDALLDEPGPVPDRVPNLRLTARLEPGSGGIVVELEGESHPVRLEQVDGRWRWVEAVVEPAVLEVQGGRAAGTISVSDELLIGRDATGPGQLADETLSRRHARVTVDSSGCTIEDLESSNGTFVNGARIAAPTALAAGDTITLGGTTLVVRSGPARTEALHLDVDPAAGTAEVRVDGIPEPLHLVLDQGVWRQGNA